MRGFLFDEGDELITRKADVSGSVAHLSSDPVGITIDGDLYSAYPLDKTYKDLLEYPSPIYIEDEIGISVFFPVEFKDNASAFDGYPFEVIIKNFNTTMSLYAKTKTGTLYFIPQE